MSNQTHTDTTRKNPTELNTHQTKIDIQISKTLPNNHTKHKEKSNKNNSSNSNTDNIVDSQNFFQTFAPLFSNNGPVSHSRPLLYPEHSFKPSYRTPSYRNLPFTSVNDILGSGNFGVEKGGTYYTVDREDNSDFATDNEPYTYYGIDHGHLHQQKNPPPAFPSGGDFFAHFRDFADISAPSKSYSQLYVVYVNKNTTIQDGMDAEATANTIWQPKNIIEQLTMQEKIDNSNNVPSATNESIKLSKFKKKLLAHQNQDQQKTTAAKLKINSSIKEITEPLLALS